MSSKILVIFVLLITVLESVLGATCTNSATCIVSTHTTGACDSTSKVCACDSSSAAIRTGCGSKLAKPTIAQPPGYSTVVLEGKSATLTCSSPDGATLFEWSFKGSVINGANASTYTIAAASTSDVGIYKCKAKDSGNSSLDSELSDPLQIDIFEKTAMSLANGPTIYLPTSKVFTGKSVTVSCINIPIGYNTANVVIMGATPITITSPLTIDNSNQGTQVKCILTDIPTSHDNKITGSASNLPSLTSDISAPTMLSTAALNNGVYTKDAPITLNCVTTPKVDYIDTTATPITWAWSRDASDITGANTATYVLPQEEGSYTIKCRATATTTIPLSTSITRSTFDSDAITIVRNSTYVTKPVIIADSTTLVMGSRISLACGSAVDRATYSWKKDGTDIARQFEQIIQLDNLTTSDNGAYVCTAKRSMVTQTSDSFTVNVIDSFNLTKPVIIAHPPTPVVGSRLSLACGSAVDGATYSWKKDNTDIARQFEQILQINNLTTSDNGAYQCRVERSMVTQTSDSFTVNVSAGQVIIKVSTIVLGLTLLMSKVFA